MKKLFAFALVALLATGMFAQTEEPAVAPSQSDMKTGKNSFEVLYAPFSTDGNQFKLTNFGIRYRHFFGKNVLRVSAGCDFNTSRQGERVTATAENNYSYVGYKENIEYTSNDAFTVAAGYERHFDINRRLSIYVGAELGYGARFQSERTWQDEDYMENNNSYTNKADYTYFQPTQHSLVIAGISGIDFHLYKGLYLGLELGLKYRYTSAPDYDNGYTVGTASSSYRSSDGKYTYSTSSTYEANKTTRTETTNGKSETTVTTTPTTINYNSSNSFNFFVEPALRIGWRF